MCHIKNHHYFMQHALTNAKQSAQIDEVPIGAVLVLDEVIIAQSGNRTIVNCDPTAHAEINVLREAAEKIGNYRLLNTSLYVTVEPCLMCLGALIQARVQNIYFGAYNQKTGAIAQYLSDQSKQPSNHYFREIEGGILEGECMMIMQEFFNPKRKSHNIV